jgi:hypothetical protein
VRSRRRDRARPSGPGLSRTGGRGGAGRVAGRAKNIGLPAPKRCHRAWQSMAVPIPRGSRDFPPFPTFPPPPPPFLAVASAAMAQLALVRYPSRGHGRSPDQSRRARRTLSCARSRASTFTVGINACPPLPPIAVVCTGSCDRNGGGVDPSKRGAGAEAGVVVRLEIRRPKSLRHRHPARSHAMRLVRRCGLRVEGRRRR